MLRPFKKFLPLYIEKFLEMGKTILVAQTYTRHAPDINTKNKVGILISDYDDMGLAKGHISALKNSKDKYGCIINLSNEAHLEKFKEMLSWNSGYVVYWNAVISRQFLEQKIKKDYRENVMRFIAANTRWRISREVNIKPNLSVIFGELFLTMKYQQEELRVKLELIEKF